MVAVRVPVAARILLAAASLGAVGCDAVLEKIGLRDAEAAVTPTPPPPGEDEVALALAVGALVEEKQAAKSATTPPPPVVPAPPVVPPTIYGGFDVTNAEIDWAAPSYGYGYGFAPSDQAKLLTLTATGRLPKPVGSRTAILAKATCDDGAELFTDSDPLPAYSPFTTDVDIPIRLDLFDVNVIGEATACRVVFTVHDPDATPSKVGTASFCWKSGSKRLEPCGAPVADAAPPTAWKATKVQMLPSMEFGFRVVAGSDPAPGRVGLRSTCHVGDKHFVEFQYVDNVRLEALEPGDTQPLRRQVNAAYEFMRFADCDIDVMAVDFDRVADKVRGMQRIGGACMRPLGIQDSACESEAITAPSLGPDGSPLLATVTSANFSSYHGWHSAYAATELTFAAPIAKDAKLEFIAECGKKTSRSPLYVVTPLDMIQPGHSVRVQAAVNGEGKRNPASCKTKLVLSTKDEVGLDREWTLATQCYGKWGGEVACPAVAKIPPR